MNYLLNVYDAKMATKLMIMMDAEFLMVFVKFVPVGGASANTGQMAAEGNLNLTSISTLHQPL